MILNLSRCIPYSSIAKAQLSVEFKEMFSRVFLFTKTSADKYSSYENFVVQLHAGFFLSTLRTF